jgi:outer membrane immunogenic protein
MCNIYNTSVVIAIPSSSNSFAGSYSARTLKTGWTIGGGLESKIWDNWSVKAEYLYVDLGSNTDVYNTVFTKGGLGAKVGEVAAVRTETSTNRDHIFRVGLNYHFNPTLVARY